MTKSRTSITEPRYPANHSFRPVTVDALFPRLRPRGRCCLSLRERLDKATAESTLDNLTSRPWHAKVNVTMFDDKGKNPVDLTVEYWKSGDDSLRVITGGANTETELHHDDYVYRSHTGDRIPSLASTAFQEFLHPGPLPF